MRYERNKQKKEQKKKDSCPCRESKRWNCKEDRNKGAAMKKDNLTEGSRFQSKRE